MRSSMVRHGSSPRARGTLWRDDRGQRRLRIIPACAGNTRSSASRWPVWTDHPRVRGEHICACSCRSSGRGSSPRARGTQLDQNHIRATRRIIPACAGNTQDVPARACERADHPRVRGEHLGKARDDRTPNGSSPRARGTRPNSNRCPCGAGSSPRARGTHHDIRHGIDAVRIIPACAGNTRADRGG